MEEEGTIYAAPSRDANPKRYIFQAELHIWAELGNWPVQEYQHELEYLKTWLPGD